MTSSASLITLSKDFEPSSVTYKEPRLNKRGGKNVSLMTTSGTQLLIQFPLMFTWGVNERVDENSGRVSYDLTLSFLETDENTAVGSFFHKLKELQEKVLDDAVTNCKLWFGKAKMSREVVEAMMYPILKFPKDKTTGEPDTSRPATVKLKIPYWDNKFNLELYSMDRQPLFIPKTHDEKSPMECIPSKSYIKGLMRCTGMWFTGGRCGLTWDLVQAQVRPPVTIQGFCILGDSDDDEQLKKLDAEDAEEAEEAESTSPVKKKKKVVRKKKTT